MSTFKIKLQRSTPSTSQSGMNQSMAMYPGTASSAPIQPALVARNAESRFHRSALPSQA